jgi:hypothetical protein
MDSDMSSRHAVVTQKLLQHLLGRQEDPKMYFYRDGQKALAQQHEQGYFTKQKHPPPRICSLNWEKKTSNLKPCITLGSFDLISNNSTYHLIVTTTSHCRIAGTFVSVY